MKIQFVSDLHLEFRENREWLKENPLIPSAELLIIAGDTYYLNRTFSKLDFIRKVADEFEQVYLIPGNHEYYEGFDAATALQASNEQILSNVNMVNNVTIDHKGIKLIFSTMWSQIQKFPQQVSLGLMDFHRIQYEGNKFNVDQFNHLNEVATEFLKRQIKEQGPKLVVTHHLPSEQCNATEFKDSILNEGFCIDKTSLIEQSDVKFWIYGHSHRNLKDFKLNETLMLTNQLGYVRYGEHGTVELDKVLEL